MFAQLEVIEGDEEESCQLRYTSFGEKNFGGGLEHCKIDKKVVEKHQNISKLERSVVRLYNKYTGKCPQDTVKSSCFYLSHKKQFSIQDQVWFMHSLLGKNTLRHVVWGMCTKVNIKGFHTNHSLRGTTRSLALGTGVPEKLVMDHMGHRDVKSLHTYQRESGWGM